MVTTRHKLYSEFWGYISLHFYPNSSHHIRHASVGWHPIFVVPKLAMFASLTIFEKNKWDSRLRENDGYDVKSWDRNVKIKLPLNPE